MSGWSVGEHVEHLLLSDRGVVSWIRKVIDDPEPEPAAGGPSLAGRLVLLTGFIPRGRGRAPEVTVPAGMSADDVLDGLAAVRRRVTGLEGRLDDVRRCPAALAHPVLGHLTPAQWLRFLAVHHWHHEKGIDRILTRT